jgi:sporulation protein YlmC with PRC-barrel domain
MLRSVKDLRGYAIRAIDGVIGRVDDFYLDDGDWGVRYLVVNTGKWLSGRKVLISPMVLGHAGWMARQLPVALTRAQVERSPDIDTICPVSRRDEIQDFGYYGNPRYWGGAGLWGMGAYPGSLTTAGRVEEELKAQRTDPTSTPGDCHLRRSNAVIGCHIEATDGRIGHVEDLLVDDHTWATTYLIVGIGNWWDGHRVLVSSRWIEVVNWSQTKVSVDLTREAVKDSPPYDSIAQFERQPQQEIRENDDGLRHLIPPPPRDRLPRRAHGQEEECRGGHSQERLMGETRADG